MSIGRGLEWVRGAMIYEVQMSPAAPQLRDNVQCWQEVQGLHVWCVHTTTQPVGGCLYTK
jgi:hypothetical protein